METPSLRLLLGTAEPAAPVLALRAGPLRVRLQGTRLLALHALGHEVWHGAWFLYRDTGWGTPEPVVDRLEHLAPDPADGGFALRIEAHIPAAERIDLVLRITGRDDGSLRYEAEATARADLPANRLGLCLLHPPSVMGRQLRVTHTDGRTSDSSFPTLVPPWPPFMLVRALRHEYVDGAWATCRFEGDDFELEDQRNNADASFKTYSRTNMAPRPFMLRAGETVRQALELSLDGPPPHAEAPPPLRLEPAGEALPMPPLGIGITPADAHAAPEARQALRELAPGLLHLGLRSPLEPVDWRGIAALLEDAGARLRLDIEGLDTPGAAQQLPALARAMTLAGVTPQAVAVFPGHPPLVDAARAAFPKARIGGGTPFFFVQLHRAEGLGPVDFLTFTTSSIVHGADDDSVMHGLQCLPGLLRTLEATRPGVAVHTGPSAIAAPRSPLGAQPEGNGTQRIALARRDPRTGAQFGAAWALGHVASLAQGGAAAISVLALTGDQGVLRSGEGHALRRSPAFHVLQALSGAQSLRPLRCTREGEVAALELHQGGQRRMLVANLGGQTRQVQVAGMAGQARWLDPAAVEAGTSDPWRPGPWQPDAPLELPAWAVVRIDEN